MAKNKTNINEIFKSIKEEVISEGNKSSGKSDFLKMEPGNTYTVRLLPAKDPKKTFFHHYIHGWTSFATGQYVSALSLQTFGERDPISEERFKLLKTGTEAQKAKAKTVKWSEKWMVNVLVINDPTNSENNGKVKLIRYGKQLNTIIQDAVTGEDSDEIGPRVFDLSGNGVSLKIKVEKQGDFPTYVSSKFSLPCEIKELDKSVIETAYDNVFDLTKVYQVKSVQELKDMFREHFHANVAEEDEEVQSSNLDEPDFGSDDTDSTVEDLLKDLED